MPYFTNSLRCRGASCLNGRSTVSCQENGSTTGDKNKTMTIKEGCKEKERRANSMKPPSRIPHQQLHQFHPKHREWLCTMLCRPFSCLLRALKFCFVGCFFCCMPTFINMFLKCSVVSNSSLFPEATLRPVLFYAHHTTATTEEKGKLVLLIRDKHSCSVGWLVLIFKKRKKTPLSRLVSSVDFDCSRNTAHNFCATSGCQTKKEATQEELDIIK